MAENFKIGVLLFAWIIPVFYFGVTDSTPFWLPGWLSRWADVSRLFPYEQRVWSCYETQILYSGSQAFTSLNESDLFAPQPYGYRTRFQRMFDRPYEKRLTALARWIRNHVEDSSQKSVRAIRFIRFAEAIDPSQPPFGHYRQARSGDLKPRRFQVIFEHVFPDSGQG